MIFSSAGKLSTICLALVEVTTTSVTAFTAAVVLTYEITVCSGCALTNSAKASAGQLSAKEQPAFKSGTSTFLFGQRILAVSPIKCTPHITIISASVLAAHCANARLSPTKSAISCISPDW